MKRRLLLPFCLFLLVFTTPVKATQEAQHLLLQDQDLPYLLDITLRDKQQLTITFIPRKLVLPNTEGILTKLSDSSLTTAKKQLEAFLQYRYDHCVELHLSQLGKDSGVKRDTEKIQTSGDIIDYAHQLSKKVGLSTLFYYQSYVKSDMKLKDYYTYYQRLHGKKLHITYQYLNTMEIEDIALPLDASLHFAHR